MKRLILILLCACTVAPILAQVAIKKHSALLLDADANGKTNPGDTLRYTITITNTSGSNLLNVVFNDLIPPNQTLVGNSIQSTPLARPDAYNSIIGNTLFTVPAISGVLTNDSDPDGDPVSVSSFSTTSAQGGTVAMTPDGGFSFLPPVGYQGTDTFSYTVKDSKGGASVGMVTLTISNMVWYVNNAVPNGDGRQTSPFNSLTPLNGAGGAGDVDGTNQFIFVFQGNNAYSTGLRLENGQQLIGSGAPLIVNGTTIFPAGTRPAITSSAAGVPAILLASGNTVRGLNAASTGGRVITGTNVGTLLITNVIASASGGDAALHLDTGNVNVTLDSASATNSTGNGIALIGLSGSCVVNAGFINGSSGPDFFVSGGNATIAYAGGILDSTGRAVEILGRTGGAINLSGDLIINGGTGILLQNNTAGSTTFSGLSKTLNTGPNTTAVTLSANGGHTVSFLNGGLNITAMNGFIATGGAAGINVTGTGNMINSANGTALHVSNSTIGASGLTFRSVSSNGGSGTGIILDNTGTLGGLAVTGTGGSGTGGSIANKTGADGNATTGIGIYLNNTRNHAFSSMQLANCQNFGIRGVNVTSVTMTNLLLDTALGNNAVYREGGVIFDNAFGVCALVGSTIRNSIEDNVRLENDTGTLTSFTVSNCTIGNNSTISGNIGLRIAARNSALMTATVTNCTFQGNRTDAINCDAGENSTLTINVSGNTIVAGTTGNNQGNIGINLTAGLNGQVAFNIAGNKIGTDGTAKPLLNTGINVFNGTLASSNPASMSGTVLNNNIVNAGAGVSGHGIRVFNQGYGTIAARVSGNNVSNVGFDYGVLIEASSNSGAAAAPCTTTVGVTGNTVNVLPGALDAIRLQARGRGVVNARVTQNVSNGGGTGFRGLAIRQASQNAGGSSYTATFNLEGLPTGLQGNYNTIVSYLQTQNPAITLANCDALFITGITGVPTVTGIP